MRVESRAHRSTKWIKTVLLTGIAVASLAGTSVVAFAYPQPKGHEDIKCDPGHVDANNGSCSITFTDKDKSDNPRSGQSICFTVSGPGTVSPTCAITDSKGQARATYATGTVTCTSDEMTATITGAESAAGDEANSATTQVEIQCPKVKGPKPPKPPHNKPNHPAHNTGAFMPTVGPTQAFSALGVLAVIVMLAVAITGRLRLRRLRR